MDSKDFQLFNKEVVPIFRSTLKAIEALLPELKKLYEGVVDESTKDVRVTNRLEIDNLPDEISISNVSEFTRAIENLKTALLLSIEENSPEAVYELVVTNIKDAKSDKVAITNWEKMASYFTKLEKAIKESAPIINTTKQDVKFPNTAKDYVSVRLTDGKKFYEAMSKVVSNMAAIETDPLVGYQPADEDKSTATRYYGFTRKNGVWYIMKHDTTAGTYRYAWGAPSENGGGWYADAWTDRVNLTYDYFHVVY